jgi:hypothetical protein
MPGLLIFPCCIIIGPHHEGAPWYQYHPVQCIFGYFLLAAMTCVKECTSYEEPLIHIIAKHFPKFGIHAVNFYET